MMMITPQGDNWRSNLTGRLLHATWLYKEQLTPLQMETKKGYKTSDYLRFYVRFLIATDAPDLQVYILANALIKTLLDKNAF